MSNGLEGYLFDHNVVYKNAVCELRNTSCLIKYCSSSSDRTYQIDKQTEGIVYLPQNNLDLLFQYVDWKFVFTGENK